MCVCVCVCFGVRAHGFWGRISRKRLEIETWYQWTTNSESIGHNDRWRRVTLKGQDRVPKMFGAHYLENGWRYSLGYNRAPVGNGTWGIKWSHDRWRQWSVNRDLGMFGAREALSKKSHGIGQTPCSYEHYLIILLLDLLLLMFINDSVIRKSILTLEREKLHLWFSFLSSWSFYENWSKPIKIL